MVIIILIILFISITVTWWSYLEEEEPEPSYYDDTSDGWFHFNFDFDFGPRRVTVPLYETNTPLKIALIPMTLCMILVSVYTTAILCKIGRNEPSGKISLLLIPISILPTIQILIFNIIPHSLASNYAPLQSAATNTFQIETILFIICSIYLSLHYFSINGKISSKWPSVASAGIFFFLLVLVLYGLWSNESYAGGKYTSMSPEDSGFLQFITPDWLFCVLCIIPFFFGFIWTEPTITYIERKRELALALLGTDDEDVSLSLAKKYSFHDISGFILAKDTKNLDEAARQFEMTQEWDKARICREKKRGIVTEPFELRDLIDLKEIFPVRKRGIVALCLLCFSILLILISLMMPFWASVDYNEKTSERTIGGEDVHVDLGIYYVHEERKNVTTGTISSELKEPTSPATGELISSLFVGLIFTLLLFCSIIPLGYNAMQRRISGKIVFFSLLVPIIVLSIFCYSFLKDVHNTIYENHIDKNDSFISIIQISSPGICFFLVLFALCIIAISAIIFFTLKGPKNRLDWAEGYFHARDFEPVYKILREYKIPEVRIYAIKEEVRQRYGDIFDEKEDVEVIEEEQEKIELMVSCPKCAQVFSIVSGSKQITCPSCGTTGDIE